MKKITKEYIDVSLELADKEQSKVGEREKELFGFSSNRLKALLNNLCAQKDTKYLEIGVYKGSTIISAAYANPTLKAVGVDNYSYDEREPKKFAPEGTIWSNVQSQLKSNLARYNEYPEQVDVKNVKIVEEDYKTVQLEDSDFDICFFDVSPIQEDTYTAFFDNILPQLNKECVIIFSNYSNERVADKLDQTLLDYKSKFAITHRAHRVSGGLSDATQYFSGVLIVSILKAAETKTTEKTPKK